MEQAILEAAERLFLEKGLSLTSTTEIAKEAGCNQALVHYYFRTKDKLFEGIFQKKILVFINAFMSIDQEDIPFEKKLQRKIESHFDMLLENPQLPFLFLNELITNPLRIGILKEKLGEYPSPVYSQFEKEFKEEIRRGRIRDMQPVHLLLSIFSLNIGVFLVKPLMMELLGMSEDAFYAFALQRKAENVKTVLHSLKPGQIN
jgi:TetR/AcrR family transcriptional regulator